MLSLLARGGGSGHRGGLAARGVCPGGGRGHFGLVAIYCITTWCFALKGLRTITSVVRLPPVVGGRLRGRKSTLRSQIEVQPLSAHHRKQFLFAKQSPKGFAAVQMHLPIIFQPLFRRKYYLAHEIRRSNKQLSIETKQCAANKSILVQKRATQAEVLVL